MINHKKTTDACDTSKYEVVPCDLCGSDRFRVLFKKRGFNIVKCKICGLSYLNKRLKGNVREERYNEGLIAPSEHYRRTESIDRKSFEELLDFAERYVNKGSLLDIGCSVGTLMEVARARGWKVEGVDLIKDAIADCKKNNLPGMLIDIEDYEKKYKGKKKFNLIVMSGIIEHLSSPRKVLGFCNSLLKDDGCVVITTPYFGSLLAKIMRGRWFHIRPQEHLYYFDKKSITKLLNKTGFNDVVVNNYERYRDANSLIRAFPVLKLIKPLLEKLIPNGVKLYINDEIIILAQKQDRNLNRLNNIQKGKEIQ